jgi:hypothetical protein
MRRPTKSPFSPPRHATLERLHAEPEREPINPEWSMTSALLRITDSSRTSREVRKVP